MGEDVYPPLPVKGVHISKESGRLCRVERFDNVDVAVVGLLVPAVVAELPPRHDLAQIGIVMNVPGAHLLDEIVVCRMPGHFLGVHDGGDFAAAEFTLRLW